LKKTSLRPLRQGQRLDTSETKQNSSKEHKPPKQSSKNHKELPLHTCKLPLNQCTSPLMSACKPLENRAIATTSAHTGQTGHHHRSDRCPTCAQDQHSDRSDRWPRPVRPVHTRAQKWLETTWKPSKCIQQDFSSSNFSPSLTMHESRQKMQNLQPRASQIDKIQQTMLHMSKSASYILYSFVSTSTTWLSSFITIGRS
jgi:hypothetical protein